MILFAFFCLIVMCQSKKIGTSNLKGEGRVKIDYYGNSKCPDYVFLESEIIRIPSALDEFYDLNLFFFAKEDSDSEIGFFCEHGEDECYGNFASECAIKQSGGNRTQWLNFTQCQNADYSKIPENQDACAEGAGLDVKILHECIRDDGPELLREGTNKAAALNVTLSPTIYFNEVAQCVWNSDPCSTPNGVVDFARLICTEYAGPKELPSLCMAFLHDDDDNNNNNETNDSNIDNDDDNNNDNNDEKKNNNGSAGFWVLVIGGFINFILLCVGFWMWACMGCPNCDFKL